MDPDTQVNLRQGHYCSNSFSPPPLSQLVCANIYVSRVHVDVSIHLNEVQCRLQFSFVLLHHCYQQNEFPWWCNLFHTVWLQPPIFSFAPNTTLHHILSHCIAKRMQSAFTSPLPLKCPTLSCGVKRGKAVSFLHHKRVTSVTHCTCSTQPHITGCNNTEQHTPQ